MYFLVREGLHSTTLSNDDVGVARGTVFQETRPWAGFKTGDFVKKSWGVYRRTTLRYRVTRSSGANDASYGGGLPL